MKNIVLLATSIVSIILLLSGCARDLSSSVYTSDSTLSLTMEGTVLSARDITIKGNDKLSENTTGMLAGGLLGGVAGANVGSGNGQTAAIAGAAIAGAVLGTIAENKLSQKQGKEYIIKVDTSKLKHDYYEGSDSMRDAISAATTNGLITIVQGAENPLSEGQGVYVIFSDKRTRVIPK
jgi:outer membrane lipoprotein SlyB